MTGATALDQLEVGIHLVGTVNGQVDALNRVEALERNSQLGGQYLPLEGGGHAGDVLQLPTLQLGPKGADHQGRRGA